MALWGLFLSALALFAALRQKKGWSAIVFSRLRRKLVVYDVHVWKAMNPAAY
jgi:hypothetical protein